jgi:SAM-dependent methyltransferase
MGKMMISRAKSITHQHILSILNTELKSYSGNSRLKILDVGCGDGHLIDYLMQNIGVLNPTLEFEVYGFDVNDHGVQSEGYFINTIELLAEHFPDVPWTSRLRVFSTKETWPYPDGFFDFIISNQVVEHIHDHRQFFSEINRTLSKGGYSIHLFPLKHYIQEGHLNLPLVHKILNHDFLVLYIKFFSRLGFGKFKIHKKNYSVSLNEFSQAHADYMCFFTNYLSYAEVLKLAKECSLRTSFKYTKEFYTGKLRSMMGLKPKYDYKRIRSSLIDWLTIHILKYVSSITLILHKNEIYSKK